MLIHSDFNSPYITVTTNDSLHIKDIVVYLGTADTRVMVGYWAQFLANGIEGYEYTVYSVPMNLTADILREVMTIPNASDFMHRLTTVHGFTTLTGARDPHLARALESVG